MVLYNTPPPSYVFFGQGSRGDGYFNAFSDCCLASTPWVPVLGNHEFYGDYSTAEHYLNETYGVIYGETHSRAALPALNAFVTVSSAIGIASHGSGSGASKTSRYYSTDLGLVHFVALDLNAYYMDADSPYQKPQLEWLAQDLKAACANKGSVPWIVVGSHYPIYCTSDSLTGLKHQDGEGDESPGEEVGCWSYGASITKVRNDLEPLFKQYGVDIYIAGHEHDYEAVWPVLNGSIVGDWGPANYSNPQVIANPQAPIHITSGAGGAPGLDTFFNTTNPWVRKRLSAWGYGRMSTSNGSVLVFEQVINADDSVYDTIIIKKT